MWQNDSRCRSKLRSRSPESDGRQNRHHNDSVAQRTPRDLKPLCRRGGIFMMDQIIIAHGCRRGDVFTIDQII